MKIISKLFWTVALVGALFFCGFAYYLKFPDVRQTVDAKAPFVKQIAGPLIVKWDAAHAPQVVEVPAPTPAPAKATAPAATPVPTADTTIAASPAPVAAQVIPALQSEIIDLTQLSRLRDQWPKTVTLKKTVEFPAVLDGKIVGSVKAPAGTETHLVLIKDNKLGLEFQGGGAMVSANDTDIIERVRASHGTTTTR